MTTAGQSPTLSDELRDRAGAFVNNHIDMWVSVEEDGVLVLGGNTPVALFEAAADWLKEDPRYVVADSVLTRQPAGEPVYSMRLTLRQPGAA